MRRYLDILREHASNSTAFVQELKQIQDQDPQFWSQVYLHVSPNDFEAGDVTIDAMEVRDHGQEKGKGKGRKVLQTLIDLADKHSVTLRLEVNEESVSGDFLEEWYQRHGFEATGDYGDYGPIMIRQPW